MSKNIFNTHGEINASNVQDALSQIVKYASIVEELQSSNTIQATGPSLNDQQRDEMIKQALMTQEGKIALGQAMATPIRRNLDYQGVGRKALVVDPLPQGALPVYDRDIDVAAVVVSSNGTAPESRVFGDRVTIPEFEIVSNPTVRIAEVKRRRFNVIDRAQQKARQEIQAQEDANVFSALEFAGQSTLGGENAKQDLDSLEHLVFLKRMVCLILSVKLIVGTWLLLSISSTSMNLQTFFLGNLLVELALLRLIL